MSHIRSRFNKEAAEGVINYTSSLAYDAACTVTILPAA
jgi:hypothetical protein